MSLKQNDTYNERVYQQYIEAGLVYVGLNYKGEPLWIGTDKQWRKCEELLNKLPNK